MLGQRLCVGFLVSVSRQCPDYATMDMETQMIRDLIADIVTKVVVSLRESGELPESALPPIEIERPQVATHGDYATNVAMKLAAALRAAGEKANPREIAEQIAQRLRETVAVVPAYDLIEAVEVAGPGFINIRLSQRWLLARVPRLLGAGDTLGSVDVGHGQRINLEFVSANPTGLVTIGNGRGAFIGDALANAMRAANFQVTKEYYFNDAGEQMNKLGASMEYYLLLALGREEDARQVHDDLPIDPKSGNKVGYFGPYYETVAERMLDRGALSLLDETHTNHAQRIGQAAAAVIMEDIRETMAHLKVSFDVWFNQATLEMSGALDEGIAALDALGFLEERDGALWAKTTLFGDDKDRVVRRSNGAPTYFAADVAYMRDKFERGFERVIIVLGPDHHGYIGRLKATAGVLGHKPEEVHVLMYQQVNIKQDGKSVRMGKRLGNVVTLDELYDEVGADVTRYFYLMRSNDTHLDFDLELARKQTDENPGLSVQYAHARAAGVLRKAAERGYVAQEYDRAPIDVLLDDPDTELTYELNLIRQLLRLEEVIEHVVVTLEPHHLTRYATELADSFHLFYDNCPILKQGAEIKRETRLARLLLLRTAQSGLARVLGLIGMDAPERMEREAVAVE
jgi:arginyl-tRNA synthetase